MSTEQPRPVSRPSHYVDPSDFGQAARIQRQQWATDLAGDNTVPVSQTTGFVQAAPFQPGNSASNFTHSAAPPQPCVGEFVGWSTGDALQCTVCLKRVWVAHLSQKQLNLLLATLEAIGHFAPAPLHYQVYANGN